MDDKEILQLFENQNKEFAKIIKENTESIIALYTKKLPDTFSLTLHDEINPSLVTEFDVEKPNIEFSHGLKEPKLVKEIMIRGIAGFETFKVIITVGDTVIYKKLRFTTLGNYVNRVINLKFDNGLVLKPQDTVKIYTWRKSAAEVAVFCHVSVRFGD